MTLDQAVRASAARVGARAAELMVAFPDASVDECIAFALFEETFLYGDTPPVGLLGYSFTKDLKKR